MEDSENLNLNNYMDNINKEDLNILNEQIIRNQNMIIKIKQL
jgi:hypothetical protein